MRMYRAKRVDNGKWVYGYYSWNPLQKRGLITNWDDVRCYAFEVIPESVGQDIGLKDKKGGKIYEGDLYKEGKRMWEVVFTSGSFMGSWANGAAQKFINHADIEVIGNVTDNPKLLEGKE